MFYLVCNIPQGTEVQTRILNPIKALDLFDIIVVNIESLQCLYVLDKAGNLGNQVARKIDACKIG